MTLSAPNLDDRRFQDLVDDAKRIVQQRCPEWSDHNVSDPGVTLIETFAWMVDQLIYRLNRVPDRHYIKFLELLGVRLFPPTAAQTDVTFWLSAPQPETVLVPTGTEISTTGAAWGESVSFRSITDLPIVPCGLETLMSRPAGGNVRNHTDALASSVAFYCFDQTPQAGDELLVGLSNPVPSCAVALRFECSIEGIGVDPLHPPLTWEAWGGSGWVPCEVDHDETGGLNRPGDVILHVPSVHVASVIGGQSAGWLRCRVTEVESDQATYSTSPRISRLEAFTIGGTAPAMHAELFEQEIVGVSDGVPGQKFPLKHRPVVPNGSPRRLEVSEGEGWLEWTEVIDFADSGPNDHHFVLDAATGELLLGAAVRERDGSLRQFGAVPGKGSTLRLSAYVTGGGRRGNVANGALNTLKSSIPYVSKIENRYAALGGVDGESISNARTRGPQMLRSGNRAVTKSDYEQLARDAAPEVARIHCVEAGNGVDAGAVRVLVVPAAPEVARLPFEQLIPAEDTVQQIAEHLDARRMIGARVVVEPPFYQGITVVAVVRAQSRGQPESVRAGALDALYNYFHPTIGGNEGTGWQFGRHVLAGEAYSVLQAVKEVEYVESVQLFAADPSTGRRGSAADRIELAPHALVFSYNHQVKVEPS